MKKILTIGASIMGIIVGVAFYWNWQTLHHVEVLSQPTIVMSSDNEKQEKPLTITKGWINILLLGTDNRGDEMARTDSIMLVSANVDTHQISVISIPRDTRVNIPNVGLTKINHANIVGEGKGGIHEGTLECAKAVSELLGVTINYYVKINFQGFQKAIDAVGGIDVNLPNSVNNDYRGEHLSAGENHLSGDEALRFARARYGLPNGDFDRQRAQYYLLSALADQMLEVSNISSLPKKLNIIQQYLIDTNLTTPEMLTMGYAFKGIDKDIITYYQLPGRGTSAIDPLVGANIYYFEPDINGVRNVVQEAFRLKLRT